MGEGKGNAHAHVREAGDHALWSLMQSDLVKDSCEFGSTKHVCDALEVVCHCRDTDFYLRTGQSPASGNAGVQILGT